MSDFELLEKLFLLFSGTDKFRFLEILRGKAPLSLREQADLLLIDVIQRRLQARRPQSRKSS